MYAYIYLYITCKNKFMHAYNPSNKIVCVTYLYDAYTYQSAYDI